MDPAAVAPPPAGLRLAAWPAGAAGRAASSWRFEGAPAPGGGGTPVLAMPGLGLDGRVFARLAPLARERDLVLWNPRNDLPRGSAMADLADEAIAALDAAGHAGRRAVLLGSSLGGMVALEAALRRPERAAALVLLGSAPAWSAVAPRLRMLARLQEWIPRRPYPSVLATLMVPGSRYGDPAVRDDLRRQMRHRTKAYVGACLAAMRGFDARARLASLRLPTLVLHGERDRVLPPRHGAAIAAAVPGATLVPVPGCGHLPHVSHPAETVAILRRFLAERAP